MTLYDLLVELKSESLKNGFDLIRDLDEKEFYKTLGRIDICNKIFELLSDETLNVEVKTRHSVMKKNEETI